MQLIVIGTSGYWEGHEMQKTSRNVEICFGIFATI